MHDLQHQIATLEAEIEHLTERADQCRKAVILGKVGAWTGGLLLVGLSVGLFGSNSTVLVVSIAMLLGGIVLSGSSRSTSKEISGEIREREALRAKIIDGLDLRTIQTR